MYCILPRYLGLLQNLNRDIYILQSLLLAKIDQNMPKSLGDTPGYVFKPLTKYRKDLGDSKFRQITKALKRDWPPILNPAINLIRIRPC